MHTVFKLPVWLMYFPLGPASTTLHSKRIRGFSDEHEFDSSAQEGKRRKQLKIEIPTTSPRSACSALSSLKASPSSLFSAVSEVEQTFDEVLLDASLSTSQIQLVPNTSLPATSPPIGPDQLGESPNGVERVPLALLIAPPIHGLCFNPTLSLPHEIASAVMNFCLKTYFCNPNVNQVMLFGRAPDTDLSSSTNDDKIINNSAALDHSDSASTKPNDCTRTHTTNDNPNITGLPTVFHDLLTTLSCLLKPFLPETTYTLLFPPSPTQARQAIINLYNPGEGISPHVDLLKRYGDGIIGVSFGSGCVMRFDRVQIHDSNDIAHRTVANDSGGLTKEDAWRQRDRWDLYLPERSVLVLSEEARYDWTHGIDKTTRDHVSVSTEETTLDSLVSGEGRWIKRGVRLSVTFRWLLPGADVVGPETS